jgi:4-amino-4-deoxy-L-arabinose transferase-like glycosyltransferase
VALSSRTTTLTPRVGRAQRVARVRAGRIPAPLGALLAMAALAAVAWASVLPPIQGPDEDGHVAYVQRIAETGSIPWSRGAVPADPGPPYSTELATALTFGAITQTWGIPLARPARTEADERIWSARDAALDPDARANGGFTPAMKNPPLYYIYEALPYAVASGGSIFDRVFAMRLANIPALLAVVVFTWLIAGELFARRRWLQTLATAAVALQPQLLHMTAVVNPDVFLAAIWSAALYAMIVLVKRGPSAGRLGALAALTAASCLTQPRGLALVLPAALAAGLALWHARPPTGRWARRLATGGAAAVTVAGACALVFYAVRGDLSADRVRELGSYVWQFYLPELGFMQQSISPGYGVGQVFERFFGAFATLEATFSVGVFRVLKAIVGVVAVLALVGLYRRRAALRRRWAVVLVVAAAVVGYLALIHAVAFRTLLESGDPVITGRYLLPLVPLYGVALALAVQWLPRRWAPVAGAAAVSGVVLLQLAALGVLFTRFYA